MIRNQALVRGVESQARTDNPLTPAIKGDATVVVVGRGADLSAAVKRVFLARDSGVTGVAEIGDVARYQIQVVNGGNVAARRVKLLDPIPDAGRYLTGSCVVDGRRATDQNDAPADGVQFLSREGLRGTIEWLVGDLAPGQSRELLFDAEILQEPVISNQGVVSAEGLPEEPTDADGNDSNGDQPTVLSVGRNSIAGLQVIKSAEDLNGGVVESLDDIRFVLTLANNSGERLAGVELLDSIPARMTFRTGSALAPAGVSVDFAPPPRGDNQRGLMRFANITLEPGQSLEFAFTARVDVDVKTGDALVNRAAAIWNTQRVESNPVTLTAGAAVGSAGVGGVLYIETGGASSGYNGAPLAEGGDLPLPGFQVVLERVNAGSPTGATSPLRKGVSTDAAGRFLIGNAPPGNYVLHYYSSGGARFGTVLLDELKAGETRTLDIAANTTGRLYNVRTGQPIAGARLTLIYDRDDPRKPGEPVAASDLPVGQQGQMTDFTGFYRFDLEPGRRYAVQVDPPSSGLIFPSSIRPPRAAAFNPGGDAGVDSRAIPSAEADSPYVIRFQLDTGDAQPTRNHIPLDPLRELVRIEKKANKQEITLGDIVTYVIRLDNKASSDITIDPSSGRGGVSIVDAIPRGFKYVKGSAQYASGLGPQRVILSSGDPEGAELLRFGPYVLPASSSVTLRYQLVAGSGVKPGEYVNRAIVQGDGGAVYSNEARATVRVIQDPVFDQNMITGKVFCDDDGDGFQDDGEPGIGGARIYSEEGDELITDVAGRYHISALNPGYHLIKIDANSLPPGAEMISETAFGMNFTRGLNFKVNFAARCQWDRLKPQRVLPRGASSFDPRAVVEVWKDPASAVIRGEPAAFPAAEVVVRQAGESRSFDDTRGRRFVAPAGGKTPPIVAYTRAPAKKHPVSRWELLIETPSGETVWRTAGDGAPPAEIPLDGAALRARVTAHGAVFLARLRNHHAHGVTAESAPAAFALYEEGELELYRANWSQGAFGEDMTSLAPSAAAELSGLSAILRKENPANVFAVLEAHTDSASGADAAKIRTGKQLETVASQLRMLGVPAANITLRNLGADQPVADDTNVRGRIANRRFGIRIHSSRMAGAAPSPPRPPPALAIINGENIGMDGAASASRTLELQPGATLLVKLHDGAGRAWTLARRRTTGGGFQIEEPAALAPRDVVSVDLRGKEIAWGASRVSLPPRNHECTVSGLDVFGRARLEDGKLSAPLEIAIADVPDGAASWSVRIEPDGKPVFSRSGTETPAKVIWRGEGLNQVSRPDDTVFRAVCEVSHGGGVRVSVPSAPFGLRPPEEEEQREWMISADEFDEGGSAVRARLKFRLREAKKIMDRFPAEPFIIEVHHDDSLPPDKALELTAARAAAVKETLAGMGAAADRMTAMGKGMENPVTANRDGISRQVNRRIVIRAARGADEALKPLPSLAATPTVTIGDLRASAATAPVIAMPVQAAEGATITVRMVDSRGVETIASIAPPADPAGAAARRMEEQLRKSTAASLEVELPPAGVVKSDTVFIRGFTDPANQLLINGQKAEIDEDGFFAAEVPLPKNTGKLTIASVDKDGNEAVVEREYLVERDRWFLLALGDGLLAGSGTRLDGLSKATTARLANDSMLLHGRLVLYLRGQWESEGLIRKGGLTAHLDTAKQREREFFQLVDDPDRYYPIYGDWARERRDVNARDKLYLRFDANNSMALVGNYQTEWNDADLMRFERSYYGAKFDFNETLAEHYKTRVRGFGAMGDRAVQHRRSELASTGGTVYFLRDRFLMEGSEVLTAVVRDRDTGMKLYSRQLERQTDYVIDYMEGRVILKQPINYALAGDRAFNAAGPRNLAGHPVFIGVEYDFVSPAGSDRASFGLHLRETFFDTLTVGGGYIREGRGAGDDYHLIGGELGLQFFKKTRVRAEFAHSISQDAQSWYSADGGLTYAPMIGNEDINLLSAAGLDNGNAFKLTGEGEVGEYIGRSGDYLKYRGYFQKVDPGFFAGAMRIEQGFLKFGGEGQYSITDADSIALRHDSLWANRPAVGNAAAADSSRHMSSAIYRRKQGAWNFAGEFAHTYWSDPVINGGVHGDAIAGGVGYRFNPTWYVFGEQEVVLHGDEFRYPSIADQFTTTAGVNVQITQWLQGELAESLRPSGDNATSAGLKMKWSDKMDVYARERFSQRSGQFISTTIFGASDEPAKGSRTYGEYQIDATGKGNVDRAVLGMNNRWELSRGWFLSANYERQQVVGNYAALLNPGGPEGRGLAGGQSPQNLLNPGPALDGVATDPLSRSFGQAIPLGFAQGDSSRDVLSTGVEFLKPKLLQTSARLEFRYDNGDERFGGSDRFQFVTANGIQAFLNRDFSVFTRLNYVHTHNLTLSQIEARVMELTTGFALRPVRHDWVQFVVKYTRLIEEAPLARNDFTPDSAVSDVFSISPLFETPFRLQIAEKVAIKHMKESLDGTSVSPSVTLLWINRVNLHLWLRKIDLGGEYRMLTNFLANDRESGFLADISWLPVQYARVAFGYNWTRFTDNEYSRHDFDASGFFLRVSGQY
ncbi:MAG: hypothetical protein GMKNLPBB_01593 [Myxococcota bacterium]|nr:hypothetical protein [Myxococcota bacterium]